MKAADIATDKPFHSTSTSNGISVQAFAVYGTGSIFAAETPLCARNI